MSNTHTFPAAPSTPSNSYHSHCVPSSTTPFITENPLHKSPMRIKYFPKLIKLLDLPDEVLSQIIASLSESHGVRRRSVIFGPPAFSLGITCTRLLRLFRAQSLAVIDPLYPENYTVIPTRAIDGQAPSDHISAVARLSAENLRVIRLPRDMFGAADVLNQLAASCPRIRELTYSNDIESIVEEAERNFFSSASELKVLNVFKPETTFLHLSATENIQELELSGVFPHHMSALIAALRKVGPKLRILTVGFDAASGGSNNSAMVTPIWCMATFGTYVVTRLTEDLPNLHTLKVSGSRCQSVVHDSQADIFNMAFYPLAVGLERRILSIRENNALSTHSNLKRLSLCSAFDTAIPSVSKCLDSYLKIITPIVEIEIQFIGATVVYPPGDEPPYFKALQLTMRDLNALPEHTDLDCTQIDTLDVGSKVLALAYARHEHVRERLHNLVWESTDTLKNVHVEVEVDCASTMRMLSSFIGDILEVLPNVETLSFRTGMVDYANENCKDFRRMMQFMEDIKVLRLTIHPIHSADCKMAFASNLPMFLNNVAKYCPSLECLFLELAMPVAAASIASEEVRRACMQSHTTCMNAVENLEATVHNCDVTSVRSQLEVWHRDLNPPQTDFHTLMGTV